VDYGGVTLRSRPGRDCTAQFPELRGLVDVVPGPALFDCELVCFDQEGRPDFERLRGRLRARTVLAVAQARHTAPACLMVFDVLHFAGRSWRARPYCERRELVDELGLQGSAWRTPRAFSVDEDLAGATRDLQLEGIVASASTRPTNPVAAATLGSRKLAVILLLPC
jgi:bifunctional non-homologous end joining protein LigD